MINTSHEVAYIDDYSIRIPLSFSEDSYPAFDMVSISWSVVGILTATLT